MPTIGFIGTCHNPLRFNLWEQNDDQFRRLIRTLDGERIPIDEVERRLAGGRVTLWAYELGDAFDAFLELEDPAGPG